MIVSAKDLSPDAKFALACFLIAEINRHQKDIDNAKEDLAALREMNVDISKAYDMGFVVCRELDLGFA
jgi:hypothetical protein